MSGFCGSLGNVPSFTARELSAPYISPLSILPDSMPQVNELLIFCAGFELRSSMLEKLVKQ